MKTKVLFLIYSLFIFGVLLFFNIGCKKDQTENNTDQIERGTMTDIDGSVYVTVKIGTQWWMAENLKVTRYRNGDAIPAVTDSIDWCQLTSGASCYYQDDHDYLLKYGRFYNWYAVSDNRNIAPEGWHIPDETEWNTLFNFFISNGFAGSPLKYSGYSGFNALLDGVNFKNVSWNFTNFATFFWSSTSHGPLKAWAHGMNEYLPSVSFYPGSRLNAFSVRCLKD